MEQAEAADAVAALRLRLDRFDATGDLGLITGAQAQREAAAVRSVASDLPGPADAHTVSAMLQLARWHWYRHLVLTPRPDQVPGGPLGSSDLPAAVALAHRLEAIAPHRLPLSMRALLGPTPAGLPADPPALGGGPAEWFTEAVLMMRRAEAEGDYSVIERADALLTRAVAASAADDPRRPDYLWALGRLNRDRYAQHGDTGALDRCIDLETQALDSTPPDHPSRAVRLLTLANALADSFELSGDPDALDDAVDLLREATRRSPSGTALHTSALACLGQVTRRRWQSRQQRFDLDEAIQSLRTAAAAPHAGGWDPGEALPTRRALAELYRERYGRDAAPSDLNAAVLAYREVAENADSLAEEAALRQILADLLLTRYDQVPDPADLAAAERTLRRTASITPPQDPLHTAALSGLGLALRRRYLTGSDLAPLRTALITGREAVRLTPPGDPGRAARLAALGATARLLFTRTGEEALLSEAVTALRGAAAGPGADPEADAELAGALLAASELSRRPEPAAEAVAAARRAVRGSHDADPRRPDRLLVLGRALNRLAELAPDSPTEDPDHDPDEGPRVLAELTQDGPDAAAPWAALAAAHRLRHRRTGDPSDLQHAAALLRRALDTEPEDEVPAAPAQRPALLAALGDTALVSARLQPDAAMLRTATDALASAVAALDDDEPARAAVLLDLSSALALSAGRDPGDEPALRARAAARAACGVRAAPSLTRLRAARQWARMAGATGHHGETLEAYRQALGLLDLLAWSDPEPAAGRALVAEFGGLPAEAAAAALDAGRDEDAVAVLEQGNAALAGIALAPNGVWAARLREQAPDLAGRLAAVQRRLEPPPWPDGAGPLIGALGEPGTVTAVRRAGVRLAEERDAVLEQVRARPGLAGFGGPVPFALLAGAAAGGPVVLVNVAPDRSDALLVTAAGVRSVRLRALDRAGIASHTTAFTPAGDAGQRAAALHWLWDAVAGPVLRELGLGTASAAPATRLWWCCPGPARPAAAGGRLGPPGPGPQPRRRAGPGGLVLDAVPGRAAARPGAGGGRTGPGPAGPLAAPGRARSRTGPRGRQRAAGGGDRARPRRRRGPAPGRGRAGPGRPEAAAADRVRGRRRGGRGRGRQPPGGAPGRAGPLPAGRRRRRGPGAGRAGPAGPPPGRDGPAVPGRLRAGRCRRPGRLPPAARRRRPAGRFPAGGGPGLGGRGGPGGPGRGAGLRAAGPRGQLGRRGARGGPARAGPAPRPARAVGRVPAPGALSRGRYGLDLTGAASRPRPRRPHRRRRREWTPAGGHRRSRTGPAAGARSGTSPPGRPRTSRTAAAGCRSAGHPATATRPAAGSRRSTGCRSAAARTASRTAAGSSAGRPGRCRRPRSGRGRRWGPARWGRARRSPRPSRSQPGPRPRRDPDPVAPEGSAERSEAPARAPERSTAGRRR